MGVPGPRGEEENRRGEARMSWGIGTMGGRGALSSAIIRAMSSLDTWRVRFSMTDEGRVVTRIGVLGRARREVGGSPRV